MALAACVFAPRAAAQAAADAPSPPRVSSARVALYQPPADVAFRTVSIVSEGVRLHAEVFAPAAGGPGPWPTVIQANGWGGVAAMFRSDSIDLVRAGYQVINFDYRGWGLSDGRLVLAGAAEAGPGGRLNAPVRELREYVDPVEQVVDWQNVVHWAAGEPSVDKARIGLRGTSYSGGHIVVVAARDPRIRAIVSQVGGLESGWTMTPGPMREATYSEATRRARGELGYPEPRARVIGNLAGAPIRDKVAMHAPLDEAPKLRACAALFIVAEHEELFRNEANAQRAFELVPDARKAYVSIPGIRHYGIYREARQQAIEHAIRWFDLHLKPAS
jgi:dienelactone hydrolase